MRHPLSSNHDDDICRDVPRAPPGHRNGHWLGVAPATWRLGGGRPDRVTSADPFHHTSYLSRLRKCARVAAPDWQTRIGLSRARRIPRIGAAEDVGYYIPN